ncbi:imidazole glycerol phosphate synthase subunit HisH [Parasphaerochaeta coccoides]|uniref:Imidazole glycerol phosphate synthase subunit HisH n=1 Tax=Parasphaerochaeta coccoides (strain ATCC BAA-1237 / DSM 17374 / SPN1) TaxID=760011 RepID=F4GI29_PARC1|nr:imidazole glycerol phosphate synthase subunit HisH [Parasphaerochaeta coccoides]AEC02627.1 imidazole glycerol phosphate synthase subunit hisH [Parasphaerochaeta coccoides DSM 17374]
MVGIVKYGAGNITSVRCALDRLGVTSVVSDDMEKLSSCSHVIFPGVGEASTAMEYLKKAGLDESLKKITRPFLGICLGMQLMCRWSEENSTDCMGIFNSEVGLIHGDINNKVPHMGWNSITPTADDPLFASIPSGEMFYFVHSYRVPVETGTIATCPYAGVTFSAALRIGNHAGVQFHPEKSGPAGAQVLKNFLAQGGEAICI